MCSCVGWCNTMHPVQQHKESQNQQSSISLHHAHVFMAALCSAHTHTHTRTASAPAHTKKLYLLLSRACTLYTIFIFEHTVGKGSDPVHSRCCGNKYFILDSNCILWPWAPYQTIDNTALMATLPGWKVHTHTRRHTHTQYRVVYGLWSFHTSAICVCTPLVSHKGL